MKPSLILFSLCLALLSCKKHKTPEQACEPLVVTNYTNDTIFPSDYIMAYPGSWWEYSDGFIDSCDSWISVPVRHSTLSDGCIIVDEDRWIIPKGLSYAEYLAFNERLTNGNEYSSTIFTQLLDTTVGIFQNLQFGGGSGTYSYTEKRKGETLERLDSITIGANTYYDVLHVRLTRSIHYAHWGGSGPVFTNNYWFAKNVGLVKWIRQENGTLYPEVELVNHYIAPH